MISRIKPILANRGTKKNTNSSPSSKYECHIWENNGTRDEEESKSVLERLGMKFMNGLRIYVGPWTVTFPLLLPVVFYIICSLGILINILENIDDFGLVVEGSHMLIYMIIGFMCTEIPTKKRDQVLRICELLDKFTIYDGLEEDAAKIKAERSMSSQASYNMFSRLMMVSINAYTLLPVSQLFTKAGRAKLSKVLVWPMWVGVDIDSWLGFTIAMLIELFACLFLLTSTIYLISFLGCLGNMTAGHCDLLAKALETAEQRAIKSIRVTSKTFEQALNEEIDACSRHLDRTLRLAIEIKDLYAHHLSSVYYGGVFAICMSGLQAITVNGEVYQSLKFMGVLIAEIATLGLATYISENLINAFDHVRISVHNLPWYEYPKLTCKRLHLMSTTSNFRGLCTVHGYELTVLHYGEVLQASYKYYNLLILIM